MATRPLIVFDVNETLLDLETMEPIFERIFWLTSMLLGIDPAGMVVPTIGPRGLPSMYSITGASTFQPP
jgi:hypothetical protein